MKSKNIEYEILKLKVQLIRLTYDMGVVEFSQKTGLNEKDVNAWRNRKREWSYNKMLRIASKLEL